MASKTLETTSTTTLEIKTEWDLTLFYKSDQDPQIEQDIVAIEEACASFRKKYAKKSDWLEDPKALLKALKEYENLFALLSSSKPAIYFWYKKELDTQDTQVEAELNKITQRLTKAHNEILFFELQLGKIGPKEQKIFLKDKILDLYRYFLEQLFKASKHMLSEAEERILNLKSLTSSTMWVQGTDRVRDGKTVLFKGTQISLGEASVKIQSLPINDRRKLHTNLMETLKSVGDFAENELNAIVTDKKINDELRHFDQPYSATILNYQNDEKSITSLVEAVTAQNNISHRFYNLKKNMLSLDTLKIADRAVAVGSNKKKIPFETAVEQFQDLLGRVGQKYQDIFVHMLEHGQIDVFPKQGKSGGAFCSHTIGTPTMVFLNHTDDFNAQMTLAHEMGHAIHSERSKTQSLMYQDYTISVAEVASTFFEGLMFYDTFDKLSEKEKVIALHDKIQDDIQTIFRQIAFFNFELELHNTIRQKGKMTKEEMAALFNKHMASYMGPSFEIDEIDGYFFVYVSHFRRFFYVYSYAFGQIISKALIERYRKDPSYIDQIDNFLTAGGSKSPEQIFKDIGIDTSDPNFFKEGLKSIEEDIQTLEKLVANKKK